MKQLENKIKDYIGKNGPITFERFMEFALYDKHHGYYTNNIDNIGKSGDFYTSPTVHKAFGEIISRFIYKGNKLIYSPRLSIVELGSGSGHLAFDILNSLKEKYSELYNKLNYYCIEISDKNIQNAKNLLSDHKHIVKFCRNISEIDEIINGFIISNEFFDSIPFHRLKFSDGNFREILVTTKDDNFIEIAQDIRNPSLLSQISKLECDFREGQQIEVNSRYENIIKAISELLGSGFLLTFDYGYLDNELYNPKRFNGTYRCFYKHNISENPYINIGFQDITCSVNFSSIIELGTKHNLEVIKYITQGQFLVDWEMLEIMENASQNDRLKIKNLILPGTTGDKFKALIQVKNIKSLGTDFYPESGFKINYQSSNDSI